MVNNVTIKEIVDKVFNDVTEEERLIIRNKLTNAATDPDSVIFVETIEDGNTKIGIKLGVKSLENDEVKMYFANNSYDGDIILDCAMKLQEC